MISENAISRFWSRVDRRDDGECWPWTGCRLKFGYGRITVEGQPWVASRLAYVLMNGPIPSGLNVLHRCDNPPCCNPGHLFLGTQGDNIKDAYDKGRRRANLTGAQNPRSKLTEELVRQIRADRDEPKVIAAKHGISRDTIYNIKGRKTWRHLHDLPR